MTRHRPRPVGLVVALGCLASLALWALSAAWSGELVPAQPGHADLVAASASVGC